jgi:hypothetical protein
MPNGEQLWQPRLGFNWDLKSDGQQQLRGGIGVFAGRTPYVWMSNQYARTGVEQTFLTATGEIPFDPDPFGQPPEGIEGKPAIGEFNLIDPNFKFPQVLRFNLAYDRQLPWWGMVGTVELILSDSLEEIDYQDLNRVQTGQLTFDGRPLYTKLDPLVDGAYFITNSSEGDTTNFLVKVERPFRDGIWGYASYAFGEANNVNDGTSSRAVSNYRFNPTFDPNSASLATSNFEVEHRFNIGIAYRFNRNSRWPTTVTSYYNAQSGRPYSSLLDSFSFDSYNGDGWDSNDLFYVPAGPDDVIITNGTWEQLDAYIKSDPCLDSSRGQRTLKNCDTAPWVHQMDLRVAQDIPIRNTNLQLTLDILNFANMLDDESGVVRFVNFNTIDLADFVGLDEATGKPIYSLRREVTDPENNPRYEISTVGSRWRARLGIRWTF